MKTFIKKTARKFGIDIRRIPKEATINTVLPIPEIFFKYHEKEHFSTILDVGAHIGLISKQYAEWFPDAQIHSIEPYSQGFNQLIENVASYPNIFTYNLALGDQDTHCELFVNKDSVTNSFLPASKGITQVLECDMCENVGKETVTLKTLYKFIEENKLKKIDLLKIDAQGYEDRILKGAGEFLNPEKIRLIYLEATFIKHYDAQASFGDLYNVMQSKGYKLYAFYGTWSRQDIGYMWTNALFVPDCS